MAWVMVEKNKKTGNEVMYLDDWQQPKSLREVALELRGSVDDYDDEYEVFVIKVQLNE